MIYLGNKFSLQMLETFPANISITEVSQDEIFANVAELEDGSIVYGDDMQKYQNYVVAYRKELLKDIKSVIGHQDTANVLGVEMNRENVALKEGDILYVAQLQGGRLPEGSVSLPSNYSFKFLKVEIFFHPTEADYWDGDDSYSE